MKIFKDVILILLGVVFTISTFYACARIGQPSGGLYDVDPPRFVSSSPAPNSIHFKGKKVEIEFDELINIEKPTEKVIITPPQSNQPIIKTVGKKIEVELKDTLLKNTTYTLDFTNGVVDNNEKNTIEGFTFAFSTGDKLDSLIISGVLLNAKNLEPMPNIMVGIHSNLDDSAFTKLPFLRTTRTNDKGRFSVRNIAPGRYRVYALNDMNRDYRFDQPGEDVAFEDSIIVPGFVPAVRQDTTWKKDSVAVDTIKTVHFNRFIPDDLILSLFKEDFESQYLMKTERPQAQVLRFNFASNQKLPPQVKFLNATVGQDWAITELENAGKSISYWLKDSLVYKKDTLQLEVHYYATDSLNQLQPQKDTLNLLYKKPKAPDKKDKKALNELNKMQIQIPGQPAMDVFDTLKIIFSEPLRVLDTAKIRIDEKVDTVWVPRKFPLKQDSLNPRMYMIDRKWAYDEEFRIKIDSAALWSYYGKTNDSLEFHCKFHSESEYGHLIISVSGAPGSGFGELLDNSDVVVRTSKAEDGVLDFPDIKPGKYYLRYIDDWNKNDKWDTGNYAEKKHAEPVYYYPGFFEVRQNFEINQSWNVIQTSLEKQKPIDITKNKPEQKKQPPKNEDIKSKSQNQSQGTSGSSSRSPIPNSPVRF